MSHTFINLRFPHCYLNLSLKLGHCDPDTLSRSSLSSLGFLCNQKTFSNKCSRETRQVLWTFFVMLRLGVKAVVVHWFCLRISFQRVTKLAEMRRWNCAPLPCCYGNRLVARPSAWGVWSTFGSREGLGRTPPSAPFESSACLYPTPLCEKEGEQLLLCLLLERSMLRADMDELRDIFHMNSQPSYLFCSEKKYYLLGHTLFLWLRTFLDVKSL